MNAFRACLYTLVLAAAGNQVARADQIFVTNPGSTDTAGDPVSAEADFSYAGGVWTLALTNLTPNIKDAGQLLTDIFFTANGTTISSSDLSSQTGNLITVLAGGVISDVPSGTSNTLGWAFGTATLNGVTGNELCVICQGAVSSPQGITPAQGILGPPTAGVYSNANPSIAGNGSHNPLVENTATITFTGLGSGITFGNVVFSFGTAAGDTVSAPEPGSLSLWLATAGLLALAGLRKKR